MRNAYDQLGKCAYSPKPIISQSQFELFSVPLRSELLAKEFITQTDNACSAVVDGNLVEVFSVLYIDGSLRWYYADECGRPQQIDPNLLRQYRVDFSPLAQLIYAGLGCKGKVEEILPGKFWKIGAAGQQSREVYMARLREADSAVQQAVSDVKDTALIFYIGMPYGKISPEKEPLYYDVKTLVSFLDDGVKFDGQAVLGNIKDMYAARPVKERRNHLPTKKQNVRNKIESSIWGIINKMLLISKKIEHDEDISSMEQKIVRSCYSSQKDFATIISVSEPELSKTVTEWKNEPGTFSDLFRKMLALLIQKPSQKNPTPEDYMVDKINDFFQKNRSQIEKIRRERPTSDS